MALAPSRYKQETTAFRCVTEREGATSSLRAVPDVPYPDWAHVLWWTAPPMWEVPTRYESEFTEWRDFHIRATMATSFLRAYWRVRSGVESAVLEEALPSTFRELISAIPEVESAYVEQKDDSIRIVTLIDQAPFESAPRYKVYEAEQEILHRFPGTLFDFELINLSEYPSEQRDQIVDRCELEIYRRSS